jgi:hypothetical protein
VVKLLLSVERVVLQTAPLPHSHHHQGSPGRDQAMGSAGQLRGSYSPADSAGQLGGSYSPADSAGQLCGPYSPADSAGQLVGPYSPAGIAGRLGGPYSPADSAGQLGGSYSPADSAGQLGGSYSPADSAGQLGGPYIPAGKEGPVVQDCSQDYNGDPCPGIFCSLGDNWDLGDPVGNWGHSVDPCPETEKTTTFISDNYKTLL